MFNRVTPFLLLVGLAAVFAGLPAAAQDAAPSGSQTIEVVDTRTGTVPCGFPIQREIRGVVDLAPSIDDAGNLVLALEPVTLRGTLSNPANGKSVELRWIHQNGETTFRSDHGSTSVALALTGRFLGGYDVARTDLGLDLPRELGPVIEFEPGRPAEEPWAHVCGLLA